MKVYIYIYIYIYLFLCLSRSISLSLFKSDIKMLDHQTASNFQFNVVYLFHGSYICHFSCALYNNNYQATISLSVAFTAAAYFSLHLICGLLCLILLSPMQSVDFQQLNTHKIKPELTGRMDGQGSQ